MSQDKYIVDKFITDNYVKLLSCAVKVARKYRGGEETRDALIAYVVDALYKDMETYARRLETNQSLIKLCYLLMWRNGYKVASGLKQKECSMDEWLTSEEATDEAMAKGNREEEMRMITYAHIDCEVGPSGAKEYIRELFAQDRSEAEIEKILLARLAAEELPGHLKRLFTMYFERQMSIRKISEQTGLAKTTVFELVKRMKDEIKIAIVPNIE